MPAKPRETRVVSGRRDPLAPGFDGERGEPSMLRQISRRLRFETQVLEDHPMPLAGAVTVEFGCSSNTRQKSNKSVRDEGWR